MSTWKNLKRTWDPVARAESTVERLASEVPRG